MMYIFVLEIPQLEDKMATRIPTGYGPSRLGQKNTSTASQWRGKTPPPIECPGYNIKLAN